MYGKEMAAGTELKICDANVKPKEISGCIAVTCERAVWRYVFEWIDAECGETAHSSCCVDC